MKRFLTSLSALLSAALFFVCLDASAQKICSRLLAKSQTSVPIPLNSFAQRYSELAKAMKLVNQNDERLRCHFFEGKSKLCVPATIYNVGLAASAFIVPKVVIPSVEIWVSSIMNDESIKSRNLEPHQGLDTQAMLALMSDFHIQAHNLDIDEDGVGSLTSALSTNAIVQATVVQTNWLTAAHSIAILGIDEETKRLVISDPDKPNDIYETAYKPGLPISFDLRAGEKKQVRVLLNSAYTMKPLSVVVPK